MKYAKAIIGAIVAALGTLSAALADNGVTPQEWVTVIITFLVTGGAVFQVPNEQPPPVAVVPTGPVQIIRPAHVPSPGNPPTGR